MGKGGQFERDLCRELSLWWTNGKNEDVFWRTAGSGGRATVRGKKGKRTFGQDGDIQATDPIGQPLLNVVSIEAKKGYNKATIHDLLDKGPKNAQQQYEKFFEQAKQQAENARVPYWLLIHKRDKRQTVVFFPYALNCALQTYTDSEIINTFIINNKGICGLLVSDFFRLVKPKHIKAIAKSYKKKMKIRRKRC